MRRQDAAVEVGAGFGDQLADDRHQRDRRRPRDRCASRRARDRAGPAGSADRAAPATAGIVAALEPAEDVGRHHRQQRIDQHDMAAGKCSQRRTISPTPRTSAGRDSRQAGTSAPSVSASAREIGRRGCRLARSPPTAAGPPPRRPSRRRGPRRPAGSCCSSSARPCRERAGQRLRKAATRAGHEIGFRQCPAPRRRARRP